MENDEIKMDLSGVNVDDDENMMHVYTPRSSSTVEIAEDGSIIEIEEQPDNPMLAEILDFYDCYDLLPLANRIIWLSSLKEVLGKVPDDIELDYDEMRLMVVLQEEQNKKMAYENYRLRQDNKRQGSNVGMDQMIPK